MAGSYTFFAPVAQSVEQWTENPRVGGSIPPWGTSMPYSSEGLFWAAMEPQKEAVMSKLKVGGHVVFIDSHRRERDALLTAIWGDPDGRNVTGCHQDDEGNYVSEYDEPGTNWPCVNLVVISDNEEAQDQYGRQIDDRHTSIVHWTNSSAVGYCWRFADEKVDWGRIQPVVK